VTVSMKVVCEPVVNTAWHIQLCHLRHDTAMAYGVERFTG